MEECIFCKIINNEADCRLIFENDFIKIILDIEPINVGHVLILPKIHKDSIDDMPLNILCEVMAAAQKIVKVYKEIYKCDGYSIMQNGGSCCDFGHFHFHVFPRYNDDGFGWKYPLNVPCEYSVEVANTIKEAFCHLGLWANSPLIDIVDVKQNNKLI